MTKRSLDKWAEDPDWEVWILNFTGERVVFHFIYHWSGASIGKRPWDDNGDILAGVRTECRLWVRKTNVDTGVHERGAILPIWRARRIAEPCRRCWQ